MVPYRLKLSDIVPFGKYCREDIFVGDLVYLDPEYLVWMYLIEEDSLHGEVIEELIDRRVIW